jgi:hypothetical protein
MIADNVPQLFDGQGAGCPTLGNALTPIEFKRQYEFINQGAVRK